MSTILDALRKVEEDARARSLDARARLLFSPARSDLRSPRRRRAPWLISTGFVLAGFAVGAGLGLWGLRARSVEESRVVSNTPRVPTDTAVTPQLTLAQTPPAAPLPPAAENPLPTVATPVESAAQPPRPDTWQEWDHGDTADASVVQRSPFVAAAPVVRSTATAPRPAPAPPASAPQVRSDTPELPAATLITPRVEPSTTPVNASLSFLQWSPDPDKRLAFIKVNGGPLTLAHEGDTVGGFTVVEIRRDEVELRSGETRLTVHAR